MHRWFRSRVTCGCGWPICSWRKTGLGSPINTLPYIPAWRLDYDYPAYDLEVQAEWVPAFLANWKSYERSATFLQRVVAVRLKAELESPTAENAGYWWSNGDLETLAGPTYFASQLDSMCRTLTNPHGRAQACFALDQSFPKR